MTTSEISFAPQPGAVTNSRQVWAQAAFEFKLLMRNGEQLLLTVIIPIFLLVGLTYMPFIKSGDQPRVTLVVPGVIALAIMSTAFTAQAISVGFDRRYGVLKLLGVTPLSRIRLLLAKTVAVLAIEEIQIVLILTVASLLGWRPVGNPIGALLLVILGTAAFSSLSFALAGVLRAEATLAAANAIYLLLLLAGGTVIPRDQMPGWLGTAGQALPSGALGNGLREVMAAGGGIPTSSALILLVWFAIGTLIAARTFRWE
jgi:ABC-2 type transport system permease protein